MATPIKSTTASANASGVNGVSPAISDLLARFGAQGDGQNQQAAFSQWMEKHAIVSPGATASGSANVNKSPAAAHNGLSASAAEQAMLRARQQAAMATRPAQTAAQPQARASKPDDDGARANASTPAKPASAQASKSAKSADKTAKASQTEDVDKADKAKDEDDSVTFTTALGDGSAVVRELTPPSTIQPGDSAGMMAWLASLTHGDLAHGKAADAAGANAGAGDASTQAGAALTATDGTAKDAALLDAKGAAAGAQGAVTLDNALWQNVSATAATQAEAMMGQAGKGLDGRADGDPLAGVLPGSLNGASLGNPLEAKAGVRHESATLPTPVNSPDFAQALAEKVSMWVSSAKDDGTMTAELHLNPAEMGPINVKISLDGQSAQVDFAAAALETRKAIEASLSSLSSALSDVGLNMTGGDVSSQTAQQQFSQGSAQAQGGAGRARGAAGGGDAETGVDPVGMRPVNAPRPGRLGGLDLYA